MGALVERFLKKSGWIVALVGVLLLIIAVIAFTIRLSYTESSLTEQLKEPQKEKSNKSKTIEKILNKSVEALTLETINSELTTSTAGSVQEPNEVDEAKLSIKPTPGATSEEIKIPANVANSIELDSGVDLELKGALSSDDLTKPRLTEKPLEIVGVKPILSDESAILKNNDLALDDSWANNIVDVDIDIMRVDSQGEALVAGQTEPNSMVEVLADGQVIGSTVSDDGGEFVVMGSLGETSNFKTLTVRSGMVPPLDKKTEKVSVLSPTQTSNSDEKKESDDDFDWTLSDDIFVILPFLSKQKSDTAKDLNSVPVIVQSSSSDIKMIQNSEQILVSEITIDSISYSDLGEAILVGRGSPNNQVLVYLNNTLTSSSDVGALGGWSTELTGIEPGIYKLRIDEVDALGEVKSRIATPFKKESKDFLMNMVSGSITVQTGNSLWRIARRIFGQGIRYIEIYKKNNDLIEDPNLIYPGQVFSIPPENRSI